MERVKLSCLLSRRAAATALSPVLAVGSVMAFTQAAEAATTVVNHYVCDDIRGGPSWQVDLTTEVTGWEGRTTVPGGSGPYPAGELSFENHLTMPAEAWDKFAKYGAQTATVEELNATWSDGSTQDDLSRGADVIREYASALEWQDPWPRVPFESITADPDGTYSFDFHAEDAPSIYPEAGERDLLSPASFDLSAYDARGRGAGGRQCTLMPGTTPGVLHHLRVVKSDTTTTARPARKTFAAGEPAVVKASVEIPRTSAIVAQRSLVLRDRQGHVLDRQSLHRDAATLETDQLPVGRNVLKVVYQGDGYYKGSRTTVVVQVARR